MKSRGYPLLAALATVAVAGCETMPMAPTRTASETSNEAVNEAVGVQELRREVAELRDSVEVQRNELEKLRERQRQLYDDLDYRLRQGEQSTAGRAGGTASQQQESGRQERDAPSETGDQEVYGQQAVVQEEPAGEQQVEQDGGQDVREQQTAAIEQTPEQRQQPASQKAVASADEQAAYDSAFDLLKQSRYNDAIIEFRAMKTEFPDGALVDDAEYWIGEAYYVTRDFENALGAFEGVVNRYPDSQRVPEAMLKLGYVQAELGRTEEAKRTLNQVISQYPGSRVAISAETRLSKIR
ncbi:MAG: tol-pal system protein YbgF [Gammaproteobacteria bacterium]|nr:tol-pal system protein YbgF [Gammaproteobacteria bacterium]